jgi:hypothetical protein
MTVIRLLAGSRVTVRLSARGLTNVAVLDCSDELMFIIGDHRYRCPLSVAQFLSPRVSTPHSIDATISELKFEFENGGELFGPVFKTTRGGSIVVDSAHRQTFAEICASLWNSELYRSVFPDLDDQVKIEDVIDHARFLSLIMFSTGHIRIDRFIQIRTDQIKTRIDQISTKFVLTIRTIGPLCLSPYM